MSASACGGFDFNCDGAQTSDPLWTQTATCTAATNAMQCADPARPGWAGAPPACGAGLGLYLYTNCCWSGSACFNSGADTFSNRPCRGP